MEDLFELLGEAGHPDGGVVFGFGGGVGVAVHGAVVGFDDLASGPGAGFRQQRGTEVADDFVGDEVADGAREPGVEVTAEVNEAGLREVPDELRDEAIEGRVLESVEHLEDALLLEAIYKPVSTFHREQEAVLHLGVGAFGKAPLGALESLPVQLEDVVAQAREGPFQRRRPRLVHADHEDHPGAFALRVAPLVERAPPVVEMRMIQRLIEGLASPRFELVVEALVDLPEALEVDASVGGDVAPRRLVLVARRQQRFVRFRTLAIREALRRFQHPVPVDVVRLQHVALAPLVPRIDRHEGRTLRLATNRTFDGAQRRRHGRQRR
mmetsp:Transcript_18463/g.56688  ORF Transcript_18463/g.56688 Transcript_18463/m.56688 type:complete len:324 (-) Transcript_18463:1135-2106(-)